LHAGGRRFDPAWLHQILSSKVAHGLFGFGFAES